jgi:Leucine-rich repeat (LRR) protein
MAFYILENDSSTPPAKQLYLYREGQNLEEIPQEWKAISKALRLLLKRNKLKRLPGSFYAPELVSLLLGGNPIQCVPESFLSNFPKLKVLDLSYGQFYSLPEELGDLKDLVCLDLSCCYNLKIFTRHSRETTCVEMPGATSVLGVELSPFRSGWPHIIASITHNGL